MIATLEELKEFEDSCLIPSVGPGRPLANQVPPKEDFGTYDYKTLANNLGGHDLREMIEIDFNRDFDMHSVDRLLQEIDAIKREIIEGITLKPDKNLIVNNGSEEYPIYITVFPIKYDISSDFPIYITPEELTPVQFQQNPLYFQVNVLPYADDNKSGLSYPEFTSVIGMLRTELIPKSSIIIQNVLGNGECLFRAFINGYHYSETGINLGYDPVGSDELVIRMKNIFLRVLEFCLSDKKTLPYFNCSDRFYQTFMELIQHEYSEKGRMTFEQFKGLYLQPQFFGGPFECNLFSQLFNYKVNFFYRNSSNNQFEFSQSFDNRDDKSKDNYGKTINVLNVGGHFMVIYQ
jgi:hypothetical protein